MLTQLPDEILLHIISSLYAPDIISLALTCTFMRNICSNKQIWKPTT